MLSKLRGSLSYLPVLKDHKRKRFSSHDRTGGNKDYVMIEPGETVTMAKMTGSGCIKHIWVTIRSEEEGYLSARDMIFIDGEKVPSLVGTGTEDYYGMSWCPTQEYCAPFHGLTLPGGKNWKGKISWYRYHIQDPVYFKERIKVTVEHGHANHRSDDYSSTAYWYQEEPHRLLMPLPSAEARLPRPSPVL